VVGGVTSQANGKVDKAKGEAPNATGGVNDVDEDALNKQWLFPATFSPN
jgi:uncharacterized protein YjbJ (UPF0337 family)